MNTFILAVLICEMGGSATPTQAQPTVDQLLRHLEKGGGWQPNSLAGAYRPDRAGCEAYMKANKPALVVADLSTFLDKSRAWQLEPISHMGGPEAKRYYLLVREGSHTTLASLKDKRVVTAIGADPKFVYGIALNKQVKAGFFQLAQVRRPLKGLRQVARGKAAATLVDEASYRYLDELKLPVKLTVLYRSPALPGLTLASTKHGRKHGQLDKRVRVALPKLCTGEGAKLCQTFGVASFTEAKPSLYAKLQRRYR